MKRIVFWSFDFWMISFTSLMPMVTALRETKGRSRCLSDEPAQAGLPNTGRAPEDHGGYLFLFEKDLQELAFAKEVLLTHELFEPPGPHPVGKGLFHPLAHILVLE